MDLLITQGLCRPDALLSSDINSVHGKGNAPLTSTSAQFQEYKVPANAVFSKDQLKSQLLGEPAAAVIPPAAAVAIPPPAAAVNPPPIAFVLESKPNQLRH